MTYRKLSPKMREALERLSKDEWRCAYTLQVSMQTLEALWRRGFVLRRSQVMGSMFSPRTTAEWKLKK